jgi:hypothetical protein
MAYGLARIWANPWLAVSFFSGMAYNEYAGVGQAIAAFSKVEESPNSTGQCAS